MEKKIIAVIGATGAQGKGVMEALLKDSTYTARAITRNPLKFTGKADEVVKGDLSDLATLSKSFENAHGVFVVTNFWEGADEMAQGKIAIQAAKAAGVKHFVWSTLPDVEKISHGKFDVPHFTGKAKVDELVKNAGFQNYTFVQAPFYFQNFLGMLSPQPQQNGTLGWTLPIDPSKKVIHMADINDLGKVVVGAFLNSQRVGKGNYLSMASDVYSFNEVMSIYKTIGKDFSFTQVPGELFSTFFEGAKEIAHMLAYFEEYTYMGPNSESQIQLAKEISIEKFSTLKEWIK